MTLEILPEAGSELYAAAEYYEAQEPGLGWRFRCEVLEVCESIHRQPFLWRERRGGYRRVNCPVFPYHVAYFIREERVVVADEEQQILIGFERHLVKIRDLLYLSRVNFLVRIGSSLRGFDRALQLLAMTELFDREIAPALP